MSGKIKAERTIWLIEWKVLGYTDWSVALHCGLYRKRADAIKVAHRQKMASTDGRAYRAWPYDARREEK